MMSAEKPLYYQGAMLVSSRITDIAAYVVAERIKSDESSVKIFCCDDVIAFMDDLFLQERAYVAQYGIRITFQRLFPQGVE